MIRKLILFAVVSLFTVGHVSAAAPTEVKVEQDSLIYIINLSEKVACVNSADDNIFKAVIRPEVSYESKSYPVTVLDDKIFKDKKRIAYAVLPNTITHIGYQAFWWSTIKELDIPNSVTTIGQYAFWGCKNLECIKFNSSITFSASVFYDCPKVQQVYVDKPENWYNMGFFHKTSNPMGVSQKVSLYFNNVIVDNLVVPESIDKIKSFAFIGCASLLSVVMKSVESIEEGAFSECHNLKSITFGGRIKSIGKEAITNAKSLEVINCPVAIPPTVETNTFEQSYPQYMTLHVAKGSRDAYASHPVWGQFGTIIDDLEDETSGIESIEVDDKDEPVEYYNLQGIRVDNPENGIFLRRQGQKVSKIIF